MVDLLCHAKLLDVAPKRVSAWRRLLCFFRHKFSVLPGYRDIVGVTAEVTVSVIWFRRTCLRCGRVQRDPCGGVVTIEPTPYWPDCASDPGAHRIKIGVLGP